MESNMDQTTKILLAAIAVGLWVHIVAISNGFSSIANGLSSIDTRVSAIGAIRSDVASTFCRYRASIAYKHHHAIDRSLRAQA
jgi:hypothetical protein